MPEPKEKIFKPAPPKFSKELAENGAADPEPEFLRQYILGDQALQCRRDGELHLAVASGLATGALVCAITFVTAVLLCSIAALLFKLPVVVLFCICAASMIMGIIACRALSTAAKKKGEGLLFRSKLADAESRALVQNSEAKIRVLSDEEVASREAKIKRPNGQGAIA